MPDVERMLDDVTLDDDYDGGGKAAVHAPRSVWNALSYNALNCTNWEDVIVDAAAKLNSQDSPVVKRRRPAAATSTTQEYELLSVLGPEWKRVERLSELVDDDVRISGRGKLLVERGLADFWKRVGAGENAYRITPMGQEIVSRIEGGEDRVVLDAPWCDAEVSPKSFGHGGFQRLLNEMVADGEWRMARDWAESADHGMADISVKDALHSFAVQGLAEKRMAGGRVEYRASEELVD